eukprot:TRINITY_DN66067_c2_g3_i1.p1 TRINITY_DN66067_c2_g3~~TRINITY_DN66067_c2_g3_i1.p1  ORF type:complete len:610 (-),score=20.86 TRINITY_DN66067_c2_g3_i1:478-2307(-)
MWVRKPLMNVYSSCSRRSWRSISDRVARPFSRTFAQHLRHLLNSKSYFYRSTLTRTLLCTGIGTATAVALSKHPVLFAAAPLSSDTEFWTIMTHGNSAALRKFLDTKADKNFDLDQRHVGGWTALMVAASRGDSDLVKLLIEKGASLFARDKHTQHTTYCRDQISPKLTAQSNTSGWTPLHYAVLSGNEECVRLLIDSGADATIADDKGRTPQDIAKLIGAKPNIEATLTSYAEEQAKLKQEADRKKRQECPIERRLMDKIVGQFSAILQVAGAIRRKENGWQDDEHPLVMMFLGSSGIGKTETAKKIAEYLFGDSSDSFIRIDMSEYMHKHEVSKFIGSPPGYVGYDQGGQLTSKLEKHPKAVVLLDEVDKAHPDVLNVMLQAFDEGRMTDGQGKTITCKDAVFIMTTNLCQREIADEATRLRQLKGESGKLPEGEAPWIAPLDSSENDDTEWKKKIPTDDITFSREWKRDYIQPLLRRHFGRDEFLGRINEMVFFLPFTDQQLCLLARRELERWSRIAHRRHGITLTWQPNVEQVLTEGYDMRYGARSIQHEIDRKVVSQLAKASEEDRLPRNSAVDIFYNSASKNFDLKVESKKSDQKGWGLFGKK